MRHGTDRPHAMREGLCQNSQPEVRALGFGERIVRMWRFYLAFCRAGFSYGTINVMQVGLRP